MKTGSNDTLNKIVNGLNSNISPIAISVVVIMGFIMAVVGIIWCVKDLMARSKGGRGSVSIVIALSVLVIGALCIFGGIAWITTVTNGLRGDLQSNFKN